MIPTPDFAGSDTMFDIKPISKQSIPRALDRAERYRLLNEPREAESICKDVLAIDPTNLVASTCLILALTDRFHIGEVQVDEVRPLAASLPGAFDRAYYAGVIEERWAKALLFAEKRRDAAFRGLVRAIELFDVAQKIATDGNDDALLRRNACVRIIQRHDLVVQDYDVKTDVYDDDVPLR
ncbi:MAG: hypothetical protein SGJ11_10005 [Phycisphaerae bacterium]|nr:hypothetical protein [Phycisphaerae bacterium]